MSPDSIGLLTNPHPRGHLVYPYHDESTLAQVLGLYAVAGLKNGEALILVVKEEHIKPIEQQISSWEIRNAESLHYASNVTYAVAEEMLSTFMIDNRPDETCFIATFRPMIERAFVAGPRNGHRRMVRAIGEMVSLLWVDNQPAAQQLELYWNRLIQEYHFSLLCTYALSGAPRDLPAELIRCHSHSIEG